MSFRGTALPPATATFPAGTVTFRPPRLTDAPSWSAERIAGKDRLQPVFGDPAVEWEREQSELAFVDRCVRLRLAAARGLAVPGMIVLARNDSRSRPRVLGEVGLDGIDRRTGTGELSAWSTDVEGRSRIFAWATAVLYLHAFTMPSPLRRVIAPQVIHNMHAPRSLTVFGAVDEMTFTKHRLYDGEWTDHRIWVVHNTAATRSSLAALISG